MSALESHEGIPDDPRLTAAWRELVHSVPPAAPRSDRSAVDGSGALEKGPRLSLTTAQLGDPRPFDIEPHGLIEAFGDVELLRGYDHALERHVMIRALSAAGASCPRRSQQFWAGARFQARLQHPRLIGVHVLDETRNWVVTECARHSLAQELKKGPVPAVRVRRFLEQALEGLAYLHAQGQVHGQLQPAALLVDDQGDLKIDLPLGVQPDGELLYRPGLEKYTAPEALDKSRFGDVGATVDLYSLGMTMLELLAGDRLAALVLADDANFTDPATAWQKWHVSTAATLPPVRELLPKTPPKLAQALDGLLAKQVDNRFSSAQDAWTALTHVEAPAPPQQLPVVLPRAGQVAELQPVRRLHRPTSLVAPTHGGGRIVPPEAGRLAPWVDRLADEKAGNLAAVAVLLLAVFTAGLLLFSGPVEREIVLGQDEKQSEAELSPPPPPPMSSDPRPPLPEEPTKLADKSTAAEQPPSVVTSLPLPKPQHGSLAINVAPATAVVMIDGVERPQRQPSYQKLPPGTHRIEVRQWDHVPWRRVIQIAAGAERRLEVQLRPRPPYRPYEPPPLPGPRLPPEAVRSLTAMLQELWWDVPVARYSYPKLMAALHSRHRSLLDSDPRVVHAAALWELRLENEARARTRFEQTANLAPPWYSLPRQHLIRSSLLVGDLAGVREHAELLARAIGESVDESTVTKVPSAFRTDAGRFLGAVCGLLEGPGGQTAGLSYLQGQLSTDALCAFAAERAIVLEHYAELTRTGAAPSTARDLIAAHLHDTVVTQRQVLLRSIEAAAGDVSSTVVRGMNITRTAAVRELARIP